jgi:hypothetical protein
MKRGWIFSRDTQFAFDQTLNVHFLLDDAHDAFIDIIAFGHNAEWTIGDFEFLLTKIVPTKIKLAALPHPFADLI